MCVSRSRDPGVEMHQVYGATTQQTHTLFFFVCLYDVGSGIDNKIGLRQRLEQHYLCP